MMKFLTALAVAVLAIASFSGCAHHKKADSCCAADGKCAAPTHR